MWGEPEIPDVVAALTGSLRFIAHEAVEADIPGVSAIECGNFRDHSLHSAREWAKVVLDQGISQDAFARVGV
jgi:S-ribosylhomocysteine lyase